MSVPRYLEVVRSAGRAREGAPRVPQAIATFLSSTEDSALSAPLAVRRNEGNEVIAGRRTPDPRPDLEAHGPAWGALLAAAEEIDGDDPDGVYGVLHFARCSEVGLECGGRGWRLVAGEMPAGEWEALRREWLVPRREGITRLLAALDGHINHKQDRREAGEGQNDD